MYIHTTILRSQFTDNCSIVSLQTFYRSTGSIRKLNLVPRSLPEFTEHVRVMIEDMKGFKLHFNFRSLEVTQKSIVKKT